jgi:hypothetical protein
MKGRGCELRFWEGTDLTTDGVKQNLTVPSVILSTYADSAIYNFSDAATL